MLPRIGDLAYQFNSEYLGSIVQISEINTDCLSANLIAYDTSDGRHWLSDCSFSLSLECTCSLIGARLCWDMEHGFTYQSREWLPDFGWIYSHRQQIPFAPR